MVLHNFSYVVSGGRLVRRCQELWRIARYDLALLGTNKGKLFLLHDFACPFVEYARKMELCSILVPRAGLEPARPGKGQWILSPSCLPIPPPRLCSLIIACLSVKINYKNVVPERIQNAYFLNIFIFSLFIFNI